MSLFSLHFRKGLKALGRVVRVGFYDVLRNFSTGQCGRSYAAGLPAARMAWATAPGVSSWGRTAGSPEAP